MAVHSLRKVFVALAICAGFTLLGAAPAMAASGEATTGDLFMPPYSAQP